MAFSGNFMCTSFQKELLLGVHRFGNADTPDTFKLAMYDNSASFTAATTAYTTSNEVSASGSYSAGGGTLSPGGAVTADGTTALADFADLTFTSSTITARGALIYNTTPSATDAAGSTLTNPTCVVLDFGSNKSSSSGDFTITFPAASASAAIIRIAGPS